MIPIVVHPIICPPKHRDNDCYNVKSSYPPKVKDTETINKIVEFAKTLGVEVIGIHENIEDSSDDILLNVKYKEVRRNINECNN